MSVFQICASCGTEIHAMGDGTGAQKDEHGKTSGLVALSDGRWYCMSCLPPIYDPETKEDTVTKECQTCHRGFEFPREYSASVKLLACEECTRSGKANTRRIPITGSSTVHITGNTEIPRSNEIIDHPSHYNTGNIEVIDVIEDAGFGEGFVVGNALKYLLRAKHKGNEIDDMKKARWYIDRRIQQLEGKKS